MYPKFTLSILLVTTGILLLPLFARAQFGAKLQHLATNSTIALHGLSAADINGDGDPDALATYRNSVIWFENDGQGMFSNEKFLFNINLPATSAGFLPARLADLDADGLPDIAAGLFWCKNLGNGQFAPADSVFWQPLAALCDVNADGRPDAIYYTNNSLFWCRNIGGGFAPFKVISTATTLSWKVFTASDLDSDGWEDLLVLKNNQFYWFKNSANNDFEEIQLATTAPKSAIAGDFNGDGKRDVIAGFTNEIRWLEFDHAGQWTLRQTIPISSFQGGLGFADLDGDGKADLIAGQSSIGAAFFRYESSGLFATTPSNPGTFANAYNLLALADFDANNKPDLLGGSSSTSTNQVFIERYNAGNGTFDPRVQLGLPLSYIQQILPADLDLDGDTDFIAADFLFEKTAVGKFDRQKKTNLPHSNVQLADLNGDSLPDAVYAFADAVAWQRNLGNLQFGPRTLLDGFIAVARDVGIHDLDLDGDLDLFAACGTEAAPKFSLVLWFENDGAGNFTIHQIADSLYWCYGIFSLDVNEDGLPDIVLTLGNNNSDIWYPNLGNGNFGAEQPFFAPGTIEPVNINQRMLTDLDADGKTDIVFITREYGTTETYWYQNLGGGVFSAQKILLSINQNASYATPYFTVFDADGDNQPDLIVNDSYWRRILFLKGLGGGNFATGKVVYDDTGFGGFLAIIPYDVDGDGLRDLLFGNYNDSSGNNALSWLSGKNPDAPEPLPCPKNIWYTSQSEIDSFPVRHPGCYVIEGNLILSEYTGNNIPSIDNLNGFLGVHTVKGGIFFWRSHLQNLTGLDSLRTVGSNFEIADGLSLESLEGLERLDTIGHTLMLSGVKKLKNLNGLQNLKHAGLNISTDSLVNLQGLDQWQSGKALTLTGNKLLESLNGIENLQQLDGNNFPNPVLWISGNPKLNDIFALDHSISMASDGVYIFQNPALSDCAVQALCDYLPMLPDTISIFGNLPTCNSEAEILTACNPLTTNDFLKKTAALRIVPNPFSDWFQVEWAAQNQNSVGSDLYLEISNPTGHLLQRKLFSGSTNRIERGDLPAGLLFLVLKTVSGAVLANGRAVVR